MSDIIRLLPDSVANQIAAGEVIQRPASVIKELVENAVDAGATEIRIFIKDAGRTLIQVIDNGKGMSETDARMAFERHATSKIRGADDLFTLNTMGFRGEALPSICAISQVEMKTKIPGVQMGTRLVINGSRVEVQEPVLCEDGTNISVKNIFFNVPARRKFLKTDNVETSNIMREFERLALVNNNVRMSIDIGSKCIDLRAGSFLQRIGDIWKNNLDLHLLPIEVNTSLIKISGFVSRPEFARRRNPLQYLIVNGRNMRHPYFHKAIMNCYEPLIAKDTQPCYFLKFEVDPSSIDVNIHPTKNEIKFEYEQEIWPILQASVKAALGKFGAVPAIDFNSDVLPVDPLRPGEIPERPTLDIPDDYNPFSSSVSASSQNTRQDSWNTFKRESAAPKNWETLYDDFMSRGRVDNGFAQQSIMPEEVKKEPQQGTLFGEEKNVAVGAFCVQYAGRYIITPAREGLIIIDQHRAHLRILFDQYLSAVVNGERVSQPMMFPESISLEPSRQSALEEALPSLKRMGFNLVYQSDMTWTVESVPAFIVNSDVKDLVFRILDSVAEGSVNFGKEGDPEGLILENMALVMARSAAISNGTKLTQEEMESIVGRLFSLEEPTYTPSGRQVYAVIDSARLESMFR